MTGAQTKPFRTVVNWQIVATAMSAALCACFAGVVGAMSAGLGGAVGIAGSLVYMMMLPRQQPATAVANQWDALSGVLRAEGAKVAVMVVLLWMVFRFFKQVMAIGFIGTFTLAVTIFSMAVFVRAPASFDMDNGNVG